MAKEPLPINSPLWIYNEEYILGSNLYDPYENPPYPSRDGFIGVYPVNTITKECIIDSIKVTDEQPLKILFIVITLDVSIFDKFNFFKLQHPENISFIFFNLLVFKLDKSTSVKDKQDRNI